MQGVKVGCFGLLASRQLLSQSNLISSYFRGAVCVQDLFCSAVGRKASTATSEPVIIRVPRRMQERIDSVKQVKRRNLDKVATVKAGRLLIKSKNPLLNQSVSYTLGKFEEPVLTSKGWKNNKSFGDYFTINSTQSAPPFLPESKEENKQDGQSHRRTFTHLHLSSELVETLQSHNITHPTIVQLQTIPKLLRGHNILCAAETGSGKTLAYILPIIHKLHKEMPPMELGSEQKTQAVVLVPSRELAEQVTSVARTMSRPFGLKVKVVGGGRGVGSIKAAFSYGQPHILVATPGALLKALWRRFVDLSELRFMVIDEADTMFDPSFVDMLEKILRQTQVAANLSEITGPTRKAQLVVVGATFPGGVGELLGKVTDLGSLVTVKSRMLHYLMPHVNQTFVKVRGSEKVLELHQALKEAESDQKGVLVFCNSAATVNWLGYTLEEMGLRHARLQGEMPASMREGIFQSFQKGHVDVLLCTDIASRGLDTQRVGLVVNYDFPESHTDYIHRAGRVGRAGAAGGGHVLSFVTHVWDVELVQSIETAARRRMCLPGMETEIQKPVKTLSQDSK
ncbi:probable ATP-dependent RNA helicase DDX28 [Pangasianodon hypophthalmus]|uniref:probable ATP-dependent RNA helicase DDX28 n=1 Tax=Pangasianodon hypophthalmus TaxID=310915 RepID=UPI0023070603|nr:probable ATP-dependent RNA helicase DDX28 [Pangasianodon hypophthalmus]